MKVIALKPVGRHAAGAEFVLPDKVARVFIKQGKVKEALAVAPQAYMTRQMVAEAPAAPVSALVAEPKAPVKRTYTRRTPAKD